ncbi:hypothetical protein [Bdellovibrio sp. HCB209]|uniref:hypothetical protein n=1 Tax=Bdellovibrio sp. HCB209 TaxID=3394354 RepID=UPI0039B4AD65
MRFLTVLSLTLLMSLQVFAFNVQSGYIQEGSQYVKATQITCDFTTGAYCNTICGDSAKCVRKEPYCRNCAGTTSPLLRQLFTELSRLFEVKNQLTSLQPLAHFLAAESYVMLDLNSVFNYYSPVGGEVFLNELRGFCGDQADTALLVVKLDPVHQPQSLNYVLCKNAEGKTLAFEAGSRQPGFHQEPLKTKIEFKLN